MFNFDPRGFRFAHSHRSRKKNGIEMRRSQSGGWPSSVTARSSIGGERNVGRTQRRARSGIIVPVSRKDAQSSSSTTKRTKKKKGKKSRMQRLEEAMKKKRTTRRARGNLIVRAWESTSIVPPCVSSFLTGSVSAGRPSMIHKGRLYVGDKADASNLKHLNNLGITHIVNATRDIPNGFTKRFEYVNIRIDDDESTNIRRHFQRCNKFVGSALRNGGRVLIHCRAGVSRSVTLAIAYLVARCNMTLKQAYDLVKRQRQIISPNNAFLVQLAKYGRSHMSIRQFVSSFPVYTTLCIDCST